MSFFKKRKWVVLMEVELDVTDTHEKAQVEKTMEGQLEELSFGANLFWEVTGRPVISVHRKGWFW